MNLKNILWVRNTGKIVPNAPLADNLFGMKLSGIITTATGNPVSIVTNKAQNAISTILSYSPKQSGTGDPSPQNIRPIEGWTEASLTGAGKNLFDISTLATASITYSDGVLTGTAGAFNTAYGSGIPFDFSKFHGVQIAILAEAKVNVETPSTTNGLIIRIAYTDGTSDSITWKNNDTEYSKKAMVSNASKTVDYIRMLYASGGSNVWNVREMQIEVSSQATDYVPFITPTTTTISLGGTYYGFNIDIERGVLRATHELLTVDETSDVEVAAVGGVWTADHLINSISGEWRKLSMCNSFVRKNEAYSTTAAFKAGTSIGDYAGCSTSARYYRIFFRDERFSTTAELTEYLAENPVTILKELDASLELPITPQTIPLLAGNNTLWTDGDSLSVTYKAKN